MTLGCKDRGIKISEFVGKTQLQIGFSNLEKKKML